VAAGSRTTGALAGDPHLLATLDARRDLHVDLPARVLPAPAVAGRARLPLDVAGALAGRTRLVEVEGERPARSAKGLFERDFDVGLHVIAAPGPARAEDAPGVSAPTGTAPAEVAEHGTEELVGFADFLEPLARVLRLGDVWMVLACEPPVGGLDGLVVGVLADPEDPVVVLEIDAHMAQPYKKYSR